MARPPACASHAVSRLARYRPTPVGLPQSSRASMPIRTCVSSQGAVRRASIARS